MDILGILLDQNPWWDDPSFRPGRRWPRRRAAYDPLLRRLERRGDRRAVLLVGPRQVGKTTLQRQLIDHLLDRGTPPRSIVYFDFSDDRLLRAVSPREVEEALPGRTEIARSIVFLDEIHFAERWDRWLKQAVDLGRSTYVITGSAAAVLGVGSRESGQGRWDEVSIEGLSFPELLRLQATGSEAVPRDVLARLPNSFDRYLELGGFPEHLAAESARETRAKLREDIADRAIRRDLNRIGIDVERASALFGYLAARSGDIFNAQNRARDLATKGETISKWTSALTSTHLLVPLLNLNPSEKARTALGGHPRIYAADHGLVLAFTASPDPLREALPRIYETIVFRHLRDLDVELRYFRVNDQTEIDFVAIGEHGRTAVEVTSGRATRKFPMFRNALGRIDADRAILVHAGQEDGNQDGIDVVPLERFLLDPASFVKEQG